MTRTSSIWEPKSRDTSIKNFPPLLTSIKSDLDRWHKGHYSWFGRCNIIKMSVFPRILYLFQTLPMHTPFSFFKDINRTFARFVWAYHPSCLLFKILCLPKQDGGLQDPTRLAPILQCLFAEPYGRLVS